MASDDARKRFVALAVRAMRNILIDHARRRAAGKRGGDWQRLTLSEELPVVAANDGTLLDLEAALQQLERLNARSAQIAELRLFGGLSVREIAPMVGVSATRAKEDWHYARAVLGKFLAG